MSKLSAITSADGYTFDFEEFVKHDLAITLAIDHNSQICRTYLKTSNCPLGPRCPYKHPASARKVVCKHWLRGLCKKGDGCEFLHEYNMRRMPECWFFSKYGECSNPECEYRHIDPSSKVRECPWFARGFCKHGPKCKNRHVKKPPCYLYLAGFCPHGKACENGHPKFEVATVDDDLLLPEDSNNADGRLDHIVCFRCGRKGHFANHCPLSLRNRQNQQQQQQQQSGGGAGYQHQQHQYGGNQTGHAGGYQPQRH